MADIPLREAMICWNRDGGAIVVPHPDERGLADDYHTSVGAAFGYWREMTHERRLLQMFIEGWHAINFYGVKPEDMHQALLSIPEYRDTLADDCLPDQFRDDREERDAGRGSIISNA